MIMYGLKKKPRRLASDEDTVWKVLDGHVGDLVTRGGEAEPCRGIVFAVTFLTLC